MSAIGTAFICDAVRTPIGRYAGALSSIRTDELAAEPIRALLARNSSMDAERIDDVYYGCANQAGEDNRNVARMAGLLAGLPVAVPGSTVNRLCGSGMDAVAIAARSIISNQAELMIAGGVESMSRAPMVMPKAQSAFSRNAEIYDTTIGWRFINKRMHELHGTDSMPETAENVAKKYSIARDAMDEFALRSQQRTAKAQQAGNFDKEIVAVRVARRKQDDLLVDTDEHPRADTTLQALAKLPTPFKKEGGTVTAGNSSGVNDGAAALLLASEAAVLQHNLKPLARVVATATAGVEPRYMGMGPAPAARKVLQMAGLGLADMDVIELNEAFAAQAIAVLNDLGLPADAEHVNPNGGAIALGHPLGMSGARLIMTAIYELQRRNARRALCTMCIGVGQGIATIIEKV